MNRLTYLIAILAVLYGVVSALMGGEDGPRRPQISSPETTSPAPWRGAQKLPDRSTGPTIEVDVGAKGSSTGTAFAITSDGWWLTARHVAHGCDALWIQTAPRKGWRVAEVHLHPNADLALLRTNQGRVPLTLAQGAPGRGEDGFSLGYPQGKPGDVHARVIGQARMKSVGRYRINEPILAWAEVSRTPRSLPALGGLSGGPMLDDQGRVVGVLVASSKRRGRVMTAAQSSINDLLANYPAAQASAGALSQRIDGNSFRQTGQSLRRDLTIAKVLCRVRQTRRRPR
ncbi:MAG: trypsin-like peptidase domain-containing protein [Rhodospirillaceae bacterium]|jgi:S1-C subfamily serine protease|nr:trypsin-like peptidase domain-containing protein [Rhodospirillaceae bacterium]MBT4689498.1 trypsin-like peptidase domain-containing protein [Rhodospirillaceae bacterium]MBT5079791.1 trypsin-like peptidase domain-containing protein [Rhodospirillaceae bacterium]MBT5523788.1 trypsin-like peptidase domain-containing protein [Rhodospirillaceae bacterium]MBT5881642.1 trypsin-like peptidase domain-containing protein [Rhodospirillaceae bacterium]